MFTTQELKEQTGFDPKNFGKEYLLKKWPKRNPLMPILTLQHVHQNALLIDNLYQSLKSLTSYIKLVSN